VEIMHLRLSAGMKPLMGEGIGRPVPHDWPFQCHRVLGCYPALVRHSITYLLSICPVQTLLILRESLMEEDMESVFLAEREAMLMNSAANLRPEVILKQTRSLHGCTFSEMRYRKATP
jgi:hypothetical protein